MIERPKRSVTRFFIPLIDVLILLFCIFLLMPFMNNPQSAASPKALEPNKAEPDELRKDIAGMRLDLERAGREVEVLRRQRKDPSERIKVFVLDIDPRTGNLFYYQNGKALEVKDERAAQDLIDRCKLQMGLEQEPLFVILLPRVPTARVGSEQLANYQHWFKDVPHRLDSPLGPLSPNLEKRP